MSECALKSIEWQREICDSMTSGKFRVPHFAELAKKYWPWCLTEIEALRAQVATLTAERDAALDEALALCNGIHDREPLALQGIRCIEAIRALKSENP